MVLIVYLRLCVSLWFKLILKNGIMHAIFRIIKQCFHGHIKRRIKIVNIKLIFQCLRTEISKKKNQYKTSGFFIFFKIYFGQVFF